MTRSEDPDRQRHKPADRLPWEEATGPEVGKDVPITTASREEPGPRRGEPSPHARGVRSRRAGTPSRQRAEREEREVKAADPKLSEETNRRLSEELREVVGEERVEVPADRPHASRGERPTRQGPVDYLNFHRFQLLRATAIVLTFAAIIALITNDWWLLPLAAGLHALGTMMVAVGIVRMTTITERPSPELAAALSEEGVSSPDERFSEMVSEFRPEPGGGASEVLSPNFNERTAEASANPAVADAEQTTAMTPTAEPSRPGGEGALPDLLPWAVAVALLVVSIILPLVMGGGWMWLLPAVMVPLLAGWMAVQRMFISRQPRLGSGSLVAIVACTVIAVAGFCAVVALAYQH